MVLIDDCGRVIASFNYNTDLRDLWLVCTNYYSGNIHHADGQLLSDSLAMVLLRMLYSIRYWFVLHTYSPTKLVVTHNTIIQIYVLRLLATNTILRLFYTF